MYHACPGPILEYFQSQECDSCKKMDYGMRLQVLLAWGSGHRPRGVSVPVSAWKQLATTPSRFIRGMILRTVGARALVSCVVVSFCLLVASQVCCYVGSASNQRPAFSFVGKAIYFVLLDRFATESRTPRACNGHQWCGGSLRGLISRLDYIAGMGFEAVWITPVVRQYDGDDGESGSGYHGYWAQDFYDIDPHFGTAEDLRALSRSLHSRSMWLMLDVVINHVRPVHKAVRPVHEALLGRHSPRTVCCSSRHAVLPYAQADQSAVPLPQRLILSPSCRLTSWSTTTSTGRQVERSLTF